MIDSIVDEVRNTRAQIAAECNYDLQQIADHASQSLSKIANVRYATPQQLQLLRGENLPAPDPTPREGK